MILNEIFNVYNGDQTVAGHDKNGNAVVENRNRKSSMYQQND